MTATLDQRLFELAETTHAQIQPSPELYRRIRTATAPRSTPGWWARPVVLAAAASVVVLTLCLGVLIRTSGHHTGRIQVSGGAITKQQWIQHMNDACRSYIADNPVPPAVFPTAQGYAAAAAALIPSIQRDVDSPNTDPVPYDAVPVVAASYADQRQALVQLQTAVSLAQGPNPSVAAVKAAYDAASQDLTNAGNVYAAYGATACGSSPGSGASQP